MKEVLRGFIAGLIHAPSKLLLLLVIAHLIQGVVLGSEAFRAGKLSHWSLLAFLTIVVVCAWRIYKAIQGIKLVKEFE
jgi:hypothetical protein